MRHALAEFVADQLSIELRLTDGTDGRFPHSGSAQ